jgi:hypothetical protein
VLVGGRQDLAEVRRSVSMERATKVASAPSARLTGFTGWSMEPNGVDLCTAPSGEVGEYWPLVSP